MPMPTTNTAPFATIISSRRVGGKIGLTVRFADGTMGAVSSDVLTGVFHYWMQEESYEKYALLCDLLAGAEYA